jgi:hypothetical protein
MRLRSIYRIDSGLRAGFVSSANCGVIALFQWKGIGRQAFTCEAQADIQKRQAGI